MQFTFFYDGFCPLCVAEMFKLTRYDRFEKIHFVNIRKLDFEEYYPDLNWHMLTKRIHAMDEDGNLLSGLDALHQVWSRAGRPHLYAWTRWPLIRSLTDYGYNWFSRHRQQLADLLGLDSGLKCNCYADHQ